MEKRVNPEAKGLQGMLDDMHETNPTFQRSEDGFLVPKGFKRGYDMERELVYLDEEEDCALE